MNERRTTNNEQRTTNDERRTTNKEKKNNERKTTNDKHTKDERRPNNGTIERIRKQTEKKTRKEELWSTKTETECSTQKYFKLNPTYPIQERKSSFSSWQIGTVNKSIYEGICKLIKLLKEFHEHFTYFFFFINSPHLVVKLKPCHFLINSLKSITRLSFFLVFFLEVVLITLRKNDFLVRWKG